MSAPDAAGLPRKPRIAVGVFGTSSALRLAVEGFGSIGVGPSHLVLVAGRSVDPQRFAGLLHDRLELHIAGRDGIGGALTLLGRGRAVVPVLPLASFASWGTAKLARDLNAHLDRGACLLIVSVDAVDSERQILGVLLANSIDQVQLHDIVAEL